MSHRQSLDKQTGKLNIVIRKNKVIPKKLLSRYCETYFNEWSYIEHKNDIEPLTGLQEGVHYHIVGRAIENRQRLQTHLNNLIDFFKFDNAEGIQIEQYNSYEGSLQYLIHKNNPEKTQHKADEIVSNMEVKELTNLLTSEVDTLNFQRVYNVCSTSNNIVEVIRELGFHLYHRYRATIRDIFEVTREEIQAKDK